MSGAGEMIMRITTRTVATFIAMTVLTAPSCSAPPRGGAVDRSASGSSGSSAGDVASDTVDTRKRLAQLEADARALAKTSGCSSVSQCRSAPLGEKACGGPRDYLVYCAATTDSAALFKKLDELKAAEVSFNKSSGMMSTCEYRMPPAVAVQGGSCRAVGP
jgi:hypothetical protein